MLFKKRLSYVLYKTGYTSGYTFINFSRSIIVGREGEVKEEDGIDKC